MLVRPLGFWIKVLHFWLFILPLWQHGCRQSGSAHSLYCKASKQKTRQVRAVARRGWRNTARCKRALECGTCRSRYFWRIRLKYKPTDEADCLSHGWFLRCRTAVLSGLTLPAAALTDGTVRWRHINESRKSLFINT